MWKYLQKKLWNWGLMQALVQVALDKSRNQTVHDLCSRISMDRMREMLDEAEKSGQKYTTLARLIEDNYKTNDFL